VATPIPVAVPIVPAVGPRPGRGRRTLRAVGRGAEWLFGVAALLAALGALAAVPVLQFLSLGYMLEAAGRAARTGRVRDGLVGVRTAARLGVVVAGVWVLLLPARFVADFAHSAEVIDPAGPVAQAWRVGLYALIGVTAVHIVGACGRGGRVRHFLNPLSALWLAGRVLRGGFYAESRDAVWATVVSLKLPYLFWLGVRGFAVGLAWLAVPAALLAAARNPGPGAGLAGVVGALLLAWVVLYLPFLQTRLAMTGRFRAGFQVGAVRREFQRAPWAFAAAVVVTVLFAVPLYLLKIETVPRDAAWLPGVVFVGFIFPARLLAGWAVGRASRREALRHWLARWLGRMPLLPAALAYVLVVFLARYTDWTGAAGVFAQHAFLMPVPFVRL
ncbi:MAG: DUF4013 domain-containing protein, partial [Gemmataceae bacterium]